MAKTPKLCPAILHLVLRQEVVLPTQLKEKMKVLPKADFESEEDAKYSSPKVHSRHHTIKCMFLGVVSPHDSYEDSDGKLMIKRVSKKSKSKAVSTTKTFISDFIINNNCHVHWQGNGAYLCTFPD